MAQKVQHITVTAQEAGQKLFGFLRRRLGTDIPPSLLMRLIRSGQVRVDKCRFKPYSRISEGSVVRIPPIKTEAVKPSPFCNALPVVVTGQGWVAIDKPIGLPVHPGSKHTDAVTVRLQHMFEGAPFMPAPAHRLDLHTSGLLLVGTSYKGLYMLQEGFKNKTIGKHYLAVVQGVLPVGSQLKLADNLAKVKEKTTGRELVRTGKGKTALAKALCLKSLLPDKSLLHIELYTGRTHQIRVQLANRGFPIVGDRKYGYNGRENTLYLHAWKIVMPDGETISLKPPWDFCLKG